MTKKWNYNHVAAGTYLYQHYRFKNGTYVLRKNPVKADYATKMALGNRERSYYNWLGKISHHSLH